MNFWNRIKTADPTAILAKYSDLLLPVGFVLAIATFIFQIHPEIVSVLILLNLAISIIVLVTSLNINSPVQLTSFPTILLLTTIFRLTLSISATRNILTVGDGGSVINALGSVTAGGSIIVGAVMFIMILVVQFVVVTKGAERVSEVAARFTLDAMPGKQMAIDADLRSGLISQDNARALRRELQRESQFHGAMDGAMKFVKGDAIATAAIAFVNIFAGLIVGVAVKGLSLPAAAQKYTILTFGDGLAAVISSILMTIAAGIVVTRISAGDEQTNLGADIGSQIFSNPRAFFITAGLLVLMTPLTFLAGAVGLTLGGAGVLLWRRQKFLAEQAAKNSGADADDFQPTFTVPLAVVVSRELSGLVDQNTLDGARFRAELPKLRAAFYYDLGVMLPFCQITTDAPLKPNQYFIALKEIPVGYGTIRPDCVFVNDSAENIAVFGLTGETAANPADFKPGAWISAAQQKQAAAAGLKIWQPAEFIALHLFRVMSQHAHEFLGIQEAQGYLDFASRGVPKLVEEVVPKIVSLQQFTEVLQRLVQEGISIRDVKSILDALGEAGRVEKDSALLTEQVRASLRRYISFRYTGGRNTLFVFLLEPEIEDVIRGAVRRTETGAFLSLDPSVTHEILDAVRRQIVQLPPNAQPPVILTDAEIRRFVRKMVELEFPQLAVVSFQELTPELNVQPVGRVSMRRAVVGKVKELSAFENELAEYSLSEG